MPWAVGAPSEARRTQDIKIKIFKARGRWLNYSCGSASSERCALAASASISRGRRDKLLDKVGRAALTTQVKRKDRRLNLL